jgi:hypothetical protein
MAENYIDSTGDAFNLDRMLENVQLLDGMIKDYKNRYMMATAMMIELKKRVDYVVDGCLESAMSSVDEIEKAYDRSKSPDMLLRQFQQLSFLANVMKAYVLTVDNFDELVQNGRLDDHEISEIREQFHGMSQLDNNFLKGGASIEAIRYFNNLYNSKN